MNRNVRKRTFLHVRPSKTQIGRASAQSDQSLRCPHEETLHPSLSKICTVKILNVQTDLNLNLAHIFEGTFLDIAAPVFFEKF